MSKALKLEAIKLSHPEIKGIKIKDLKTHSLRALGGNDLYLAGYKNKKIQKIGQ